MLVVILSPLLVSDLLTLDLELSWSQVNNSNPYLCCDLLLWDFLFLHEAISGPQYLCIYSFPSSSLLFSHGYLWEGTGKSTYTSALQNQILITVVFYRSWAQRDKYFIK
jgi:hypothetical protein